MSDDDWDRQDKNNTLDDDFDLKLEDIPTEKTGSFTAALFDAVRNLTHHVQHIKITLTPSVQNEDEDDDCTFDLRMTDVPLEELPSVQHTPYFMQIKQNVMKGRRPRAILFSTLLLIMLITLVNTIAPLHDRLIGLFPVPATPSQNPLSPYPGHLLDNPTNAVVEQSKTTVSQVTVDGQQKYLYIPAAVPYECPTSVLPGYERQIGNFPVWLSSFGAPNTVLHLQPSFVTSRKDWQGWSVNFQVNVKLRYTSIILLSINDVNHISSPLLRDPSDGSHTWRIVLNPLKPQHALGPTGKQYIGTWNMSLYLPGAGCYALDAAWNEGSWEVVFSAGR